MSHKIHYAQLIHLARHWLGTARGLTGVAQFVIVGVTVENSQVEGRRRLNGCDRRANGIGA